MPNDILDQELQIMSTLDYHHHCLHCSHWSAPSVTTLCCWSLFHCFSSGQSSLSTSLLSPRVSPLVSPPSSCLSWDPATMRLITWPGVSTSPGWSVRRRAPGSQQCSVWEPLLEAWCQHTWVRSMVAECRCWCWLFLTSWAGSSAHQLRTSGWCWLAGEYSSLIGWYSTILISDWLT